MASSRVTITESEILSELRAELATEERQPGYYTVGELAKELKCDGASVRRRLNAWKVEGRLDQMRVRVFRDDGQSQLVMVYKLKPQSKSKR
jgi:hypothetical protein